MIQNVIEYHHINLPAPNIEIGKPTYIFPAELMTRDDGVVQRKYGLTKTGIVLAHDSETGIFYTSDTKYVLRT